MELYCYIAIYVWTINKIKKKYINQLNSNPYTNIKNILSALLHITFLPAICYVKKKNAFIFSNIYPNN